MDDTTVEFLGTVLGRHKPSQLQEGELHIKVQEKLQQMVQEQVLTLTQVSATVAAKSGWTTIRPVPKAESEEIRLYTKRFKLEKLRDILWLEGVYQNSLDIRHAYHDMVMDLAAQGALIIGYKAHYYMFMVLPEGLSEGVVGIELVRVK